MRINPPKGLDLPYYTPVRCCDRHPITGADGYTSAEIYFHSGTDKRVVIDKMERVGFTLLETRLNEKYPDYGELIFVKKD